MSKYINQGSLAFPSPGEGHYGLTMREYYAGIAMGALVACGYVNNVADQAFAIADQMVAKAAILEK